MLDSNGYAPSIIQSDTSSCYLCGRRDRKLDRHEPFGGALRQKSKRLGMWVVLCHHPCHEGTTGAHGIFEINRTLRAEAQRAAMQTYGWTTADFIREFGKNYLEE
jgi:hypothetical protein